MKGELNATTTTSKATDTHTHIQMLKFRLISFLLSSAQPSVTSGLTSAEEVVSDALAVWNGTTRGQHGRHTDKGRGERGNSSGGVTIGVFAEAAGGDKQMSLGDVVSVTIYPRCLVPD